MNQRVGRLRPSKAQPVSRTALLFSIIAGLVGLACASAASPKEAKLWEPVEWEFSNPSCAGNPFDLVAKARFTHEQTGRNIQTELFYNGGDVWKLRFTGTLTGRWSFVTSSEDSDLDGHKGRLNILPDPGAPGFITNFANKWGRLGADEAFVPQYVMYVDPDVFSKDPNRIDADIREFFVDHGFNGFHTAVLCRWFDLDKTRSNEITSPDPNPDPRTFEAVELLIRKVHAAGGVVHIWAWGDEQRRMTPHRWGLNGKVDQRLQRYICARLGPLPGWSMGYGFDLQEWVNEQDLKTWHEYMHEHLGWTHYLGARAPDLTQIYDGLDYSSYQQHRPDYDTYVKAIEQYPDKPTLLEDRFRVRKNVYPDKDYDFDMTRRGLWHSTMAGGAANIWGNLLDPRPDGMSHPYPNKHQILTWSRFWKNRFKKEMVRDNSLTDGVCLKVPGRMLVFYKEDTDSIKMNLAELRGNIRVVAVDTKSPYEEIALTGLKPEADQLFKAPRRSDWAVAVQTADAADLPPDKLPPGFVHGDVVSYSYVPIRHWSPQQGIGILPYLFEYNLQEHKDGTPLETFHDENIRRIDIASRWSTAIMLYPRKAEYRDEIINLMLRCFKNRQLIILADYHSGSTETACANVRAILDKLWLNRDNAIANPEGDAATGRQLINNVLAVKLGDEGLCGLGTKGLEKVYADFNERVRYRNRDGQTPLSHIRGWYNLISYTGLDYKGCYAANQTDIDEHRRHKLPPNTQAIGVDIYHYWFPRFSPFDPADLSIPREKVRAHTTEWHRLRTKYYTQGLTVRVCNNANDPATWLPECWNDTHALLAAIELADAGQARMWFIGNSGQIDATISKDVLTYTVPVETMELYYENLKAGPWVALSWWVFGNYKDTHGGLEYYDKALRHYTADHPEGIPYSPEMLDYWHNEYVRVKMKMFNDVVHNQFAHLNGPVPKKPEPTATMRGK